MQFLTDILYFITTLKEHWVANKKWKQILKDCDPPSFQKINVFFHAILKF